jgi:hypothetical protein
MAWDPVQVFFVTQVAIRERKRAVDAVDAPAQARIEIELNALDPDWLTTVYADWSNAGFPTIP